MRADRLLTLLLLLQEGGKVKAKDLARRLEVSPRTVYRDVEALSMAGIPVYAETGPSGGISLVGDYRTRLTGFSRHEVEALSTFQVPASLADLGLRGPLESALLKLAASLPSVHRLAAAHIQRRLYVDTAPWWRVPEKLPLLDTLRQAVWTDHRLRLLYRKPTGTTRHHELDPYGLVAKVDRWYLVARRREVTLTFRVSRIQEATILDESFERLPDFDLERHWHDWCRQFHDTRPRYPVTFRLSPEGERLMLDVQHGLAAVLSLDSAQTDDNGFKILTRDFEREEYAISSLAYLGSHVEILEPTPLRHRMTRLAQELTTLYRQ